MTTATMPAQHLLARELIERFPAEAALEIEGVPDEEAAALLGKLPPPAAAALFDSFTPVGAARLLTQLPPEAAAATLEALDPARAAALLNRLDAHRRDGLLAQLRRPAAKEIAALTQYPAESAGSLMDPQVMAFHPKMTVAAVLEQLRRLPHKRASEVFLVNPDGTLVGAVPLQELAVAEEAQPMEALLGPPPLQVQAMSSRNEVVDTLASGEAGRAGGRGHGAAGCSV